MRILLVEDEPKIAGFVSRGLREERYAVDIADTAEKALYLADMNPYDLIVLDVMLPDKDGFSVCKELREKKNNALILMLTARNELSDRVKGLNSGADDYLTKPFAFEEFLARVRALLRRQNGDKAPVIKIADLVIDQLAHKVTRNGKNIPLTAKEYSLLEYLAVNRGRIVTRTMISEHVWNEDFDSFTNVIDVYVNYLRKKIDSGFKKQLIHTERGAGYILKE
jgi:DNA-binding response OmpR family regulator